jgi:hypothetical protein
MIWMRGSAGEMVDGVTAKAGSKVHAKWLKTRNELVWLS